MSNMIVVNFMSNIILSYKIHLQVTCYFRKKITHIICLPPLADLPSKYTIFYVRLQATRLCEN
jgi:hypothetical protein